MTQGPLCWFSNSVLLWVKQAGASVEPKCLSLWLSSFSDPFSAIHFRRLSQLLGCLNMPNAYLNSLSKNLALNLFVYHQACWATMGTLLSLLWEYLRDIPFE